MRILRQSVFAVSAVALIATSMFLVGCGDGSSSGETGAPEGSGQPGGNDGLQISISSITTPTQHFECGITNYPFQLSATVSGSSDTKVNWSVSPTSDSGWTITTSGVLTPPASCASTVETTVTATADADSTKTSTLAVWAGNYVLQQDSALIIETADGSNADDFSGPSVNLMANNQTCYNATWSYSHLHMLCEDFSQRDEVLNLYTLNNSGWGVKLTSSIDLTPLGIDLLTWWKFSPDEKSILFVGEQGSSYSIYSIATNGQGALNHLFTLTQGGGAVQLGNIFYSPDGTKITFYNSVTGNCWVMGSDGSNPAPLVTGYCREAVYSVDMKTLFYDDGNNVYAVTSGGVEPLASGNYFIFGISPDGNDVLLVGSPDLTGHSETYRLSLKDSSVSQIGSGAAPSWYL